MNRLALILCLLLLGTACKSTKKTKQRTYEKEHYEAEAVAVDSVVVMAMVKASRKEEVNTSEEIEETFKALDSAGIIIIKPVRITRRTVSSITEEDSAQEDSSLAYSRTSETEEFFSESKINDLDKGSEGAKVIEQAASALFPTWGKILASILIAVVPVLWTWWKRKQNLE